MVVIVAQASPSPTELPASVGEATNLVLDTVRSMWEGFLSSLPLIAVGVVIVALGVVVADRVARWASRGVRRAGADEVVGGLTQRLVRLVMILAIVLLALSVAGVSVGAALAGLGIAGLAVALALQPILENFVAGLLLILRKPFRAGDQVVIGDYEGTVIDIDLRTTRVHDYDGELIIIPNAEVFNAALVNLTHAGSRRSSIAVGVDYRDDHDAVAGVIERAVRAVEGVLEDPPPRVLCTELGESSVNFTVQYWTGARRFDVVTTRDRVLRATKTALDTAGFTIPWPIRTLVMDEPSQASAVPGAGRPAP